MAAETTVCGIAARRAIGPFGPTPVGPYGSGWCRDGTRPRADRPFRTAGHPRQLRRTRLLEL